MFDIHGWNTDYFCSSVLLYIIGSRHFLKSREFNYMIDGFKILRIDHDPNKTLKVECY